MDRNGPGRGDDPRSRHPSAVDCVPPIDLPVHAEIAQIANGSIVFAIDRPRRANRRPLTREIGEQQTNRNEFNNTVPAFQSGATRIPAILPSLVSRALAMQLETVPVRR